MPDIEIFKRALALILAGWLVAACSTTGYFTLADAPASIRSGALDPRLSLTQRLGAQLSPIVRNIAAPYGRLQFAKGLEAHLLASLQPLDIVLVRSRPALTRLAFPSHFTHSLIWLGSERQLTDVGAFQSPAVRRLAGELRSGNTVFESAGDDVRLRTIKEITNTDEIAILRPAGMNAARARAKYSALFANLGAPFDYNFDYSDKTRLTCMETVADAFPEFGIPVRYTTGRYAIIPDDIVRRALTPGSGLKLVKYLKGEGANGFSALDAKAANHVLSEPKPKPKRAAIY